jgi:hypothetical protein
MPQPVMIFHIVLYIYTLAQWLGFNELFSSFFFFSSLCQNIKVSFYLFLYLIWFLLFWMLFVLLFYFFYWFFFINFIPYQLILSDFYIKFGPYSFDYYFFYYFSNWFLFLTLGIWFQVIFILNLVFILFIDIYFVLDPFLLHLFFNFIH